MGQILLVFLVLLTGCGSRELSPRTTADRAFPADFSHIRERILIPKCAPCHENFTSYKVLLDSMVVPGNPAGSELYSIIESDTMPPYSDHLIFEEKAAIKTWIEKGAPYP